MRRRNYQRTSNWWIVIGRNPVAKNYTNSKGYSMGSKSWSDLSTHVQDSCTEFMASYFEIMQSYTLWLLEGDITSVVYTSSWYILLFVSNSEVLRIIWPYAIKLGRGHFEKPARKKTTEKSPTPPFRPPSKATPPEHMTSSLALAIGLPSIDSGQAQWVQRACR